MKNPFRFVLPALVLALAGCASQGSLDMVRNDVDAIKTRLFSVERDLGGTREESTERLAEIEKSFKSDVATMRKLSADIQASIDSVRTEMQALNGRIDDVALSAKKPSEELQRFSDDVNKRIIALEDRVVKLQAAIDDLNKKAAGQPQQSAAAPVTPDALYMKGLEAFKAGDMPGARDTFTKFLEQYPKHDLAANAHYWIGETYYSEKNYDQAILAFQEVIKNYPKREKAPAAMLKQALSFRAIKDPKSAKFVLKRLVEAFPKSDDAKKARELLKQMR
ncbi:MAG TPA: tol-pal system protein YbgF [Desulfuromonadaceae bacterium]